MTEEKFIKPEGRADNTILGTHLMIPIGDVVNKKGTHPRKSESLFDCLVTTEGS
jgi:hypothetical protein